MYKAPLTLGIEEEYQIIDPETRELANYGMQLVADGGDVPGSKIMYELMQSQVEVATKICMNIKEARSEISKQRKAVAEVAKRHGVVIASASTHPFSKWKEQRPTELERYLNVYNTYGAVAQRFVASALHVHVGFGTSREAIALMMDVSNQMRYGLPHLLALSSSSPFWEGRDTGLKSYRTILLKAIPKTGIPPIISSYGEYQDFVDTMGRLGAIPTDEETGKADDTMLWWDMRPRPKMGTLEIRITDACTTIDEAICITAIIQTLVAYFIKLYEQNQSWRIYPTSLIEHNKWKACLSGLDGQMSNLGKQNQLDTRTLLKEIPLLLEETADELGTSEEIAYLHTILEKGTSADRQLATYRHAMEQGASEQEALIKVVDNLIEESNQG